MQGSSPQGENYESKKFYFDFCGVGMFLRLVRDYGTSRRKLDAAFKRIEELALSLDENEEKIISFAAKKVGRKREDFCIYGIEICLPSPENSVRNPIHYQLYDKCDEYGCPLYVLCDENGNPLVALFVG